MNATASSTRWVTVHYRTMAEPPLPAPGSFGGGVLRDQNTVHRLLFDKNSQAYFGYDLVVLSGRRRPRLPGGLPAAQRHGRHPEPLRRRSDVESHASGQVSRASTGATRRKHRAGCHGEPWRAATDRRLLAVLSAGAGRSSASVHHRRTTGFHRGRGAADDQPGQLRANHRPDRRPKIHRPGGISRTKRAERCGLFYRGKGDTCCRWPRTPALRKQAPSGIT